LDGIFAFKVDANTNNGKSNQYIRNDVIDIIVWVEVRYKRHKKNEEAGIPVFLLLFIALFCRIVTVNTSEKESGSDPKKSLSYC
jgi:hypothetical protein